VPTAGSRLRRRIMRPPPEVLKKEVGSCDICDSFASCAVY
jgi:hypothetical protein